MVLGAGVSKWWGRLVDVLQLQFDTRIPESLEP